MENGSLTQKISLPMRWLALAAAVEVGLVVLAATPVQSATTPAAASQSPVVDYARSVAQALRHTETGF